MCWSCSCGFSAMAFPKIPLFAAYLLLLSYWVDVCHQSNDDYDDDEYSSREALLEKIDLSDLSSHSFARLCTCWPIHIGSRQRTVVLVTVLVFVITLASAILMWIWRGESTMNSNTIAQIYVVLTAIINLLLGGALASYGLVLVLKMRKVRSEQVAYEMRKVTGLAIVSLVSFTSSSLIAMTTKIPLFYGWKEGRMSDVSTSVLLVLFYIIGSTLPSLCILFVMKDLPQPPVIKREEESRTIAFFNEEGSASHHPQRWTVAAASTGNQFSRASPI